MALTNSAYQWRGSSHNLPPHVSELLQPIDAGNSKWSSCGGCLESFYCSRPQFDHSNPTRPLVHLGCSGRGAPNFSSRPDEVTLTVMLQAPAGVPIHRILLFNYEVLWYAEITRVAITGSRGVIITPRLPAAGIPPVLGGPQHAVPGVAQNNIPCLVGGSLSAGLSVLHGGVAVRHHHTLILPAMQGHDTDRSNESGGSSLHRHRIPVGHSPAPAPISSEHQADQQGTIRKLASSMALVVVWVESLILPCPWRYGG
jgi:hypothetical protein